MGPAPWAPHGAGAIGGGGADGIRHFTELFFVPYSATRLRMASEWAPTLIKNDPKIFEKRFLKIFRFLIFWIFWIFGLFDFFEKKQKVSDFGRLYLRD